MGLYLENRRRGASPARRVSASMDSHGETANRADRVREGQSPEIEDAEQFIDPGVGECVGPFLHFVQPSDHR